MNQFYRYSLPVCCIAFSFLPAAGQSFSCGADPMHQRLFDEYPALQKTQETYEWKRYEQLAQHTGPSAGKGTMATYTIPVVVHIVHLNGPENINNTQVVQAINWLNAAFANTGYYDQGTGAPTPFQFCLARQTPDGQATNGIKRVLSPLTNMTMETQDLAVKNLSRWNPQHYLNIWLVRSVTSQSSGPGVAGYAYFPASHGTDIDGIVMEAEFFGSSAADNGVLIHEVGHYLGLYHTFQGGCTNSDCAKDGDQVCDTPPDQSTAWLPCGTPANTCSTDTQSGFSTDQEDMTINYMDYATLDCYSAFTAGQSSRMEFFMTEARASLLASKGCLNPCTQPVSAAFSASVGNLIDIGTSAVFTVNDTTALIYEWYVDGVLHATGRNTTFVFGNLGQHIVTLSVQGADSNCFESVSDTFLVVCDVQAGFDIAPLPIHVAEEVFFSNTTTGNVQNLEWTLDGNPESTATSWSQTFILPGVHAVCLTASNTNCQDVYCQSFEVTDSSDCQEAFLKKIDYGHNLYTQVNKLAALPGGGLLGCGSLPSKTYGLFRFTQQGDLVKHWQILPDDGQIISDMHVTTDGHVLLLTALLSGGSACFLVKFNYTTGQVVWHKQLALANNLNMWKITENPASQNYQVFGRNAGNTQVIVLEINALNGALVAQQNYNSTQCPLVRSGIWVGNDFYGAGSVRTGLTTGKAMLAKFNATGLAQWTRQYEFAATGLFADSGIMSWSEIKRDKDHLVLAGANNDHVFFLKTDLDGQPVSARVFYQGLTIDYYTHADKVSIEVLADGYLICFSIYGRTYFVKTDVNGDVVWKKEQANPIGMNGFDAVTIDKSVFAFGARTNGTDELFLLKTPLLPVGPADCLSDSLPLAVAIPTWAVQSGFPSVEASPQVVVNDRFATVQLLLHPLETVCSASVCPEICDNNLDDDGDGLFDCADTVDCPCDDGLPDCAIPLPPVAPKVIGRTEWKSVGNNIETFRQTIVANLNPQQDNIPEILAITYDPDVNMPRHIRIYTGDGSNAANPAQLNMTGTYINSPVSMAVGDLDGNGVPELVVIFNNKNLRIFSNYNPQANPVLTTMLQGYIVHAINPHISLADFNGDGRSEIFVGQQVFSLIYSPLGQPQLVEVKPVLALPAQNFYHSFAADMLSVEDCNGDPDCAGLELVTGTTIFSVDLDATAVDGDPRAIIARRTVDAVPGGGVYADGPAVVADVDLDGVLDVVVRAQPQGWAKSYLYVWNAQKFIKQIAHPDFGPLGAIGLPSVAEVFDDTQKGAAKNLPEIFFSAPYRLYCLNLNAAEMDSQNPFWWSLIVDDPHNFSNPVSTFDFDGNGQPEIVFRDQESLQVLYGGNLPFPTGVNPDRSWFKISGKSGTYEEYPVIADVDSDGQAEIVFTGGNQPQSLDPYTDGQLIVVGADLTKSGPWKPTRRLWNQSSYAPHLINDNLSIPAVPQQSHLEIPAGSGYRPLNIVLGQKPVPAFYNGYVYLPDATLDIVETECAGNTVEVWLRVCNLGSGALPAGTPIRFYLGDPTTTAAVRLPATLALTQELAVDSCINFTVSLPKHHGQKIFAVVNDNGTRATPFNLSTDFPITGIEECVYTNNMAAFELPPALAKPQLGPDVNVCENGVWTFSAGAGYPNYRWSTLSTDSSITVYEPGTYWVEITDLCGIAYRDTVVVVVHPAGIVDLGPDRVICQDSAIQLLATSGFVEYTWFPVLDLSCSDCPNPVTNPGQSRTYTVQAKSQLGCFSFDTVFIAVNLPQNMVETLELCAGDSMLIFGNYETASGMYTRTFQSANGCDSVHQVVLTVLPVFQTAETRQLCAGDSMLIFGNYETASGMYARTFQSANGCDSVHQVELTVLPVFQTAETRQLCAGDSMLIFGNYETASGMYARTFQSANGCDSVHQVVLTVLPVFQTAETRQLCAGDSLLVFGNYETAAGVYVRTFQSVNGCDSVHQVELTVLPVFQTAETRQLCAGDSLLVFGNYETVGGMYSRTFQSVNGCDSVHQVVLTVLPVFQTAETRYLCAGDSVLVFGNYENTSGTFMQTFQASGGCDSIHTVELSVWPTIQITEARQICTGDSTLVFGAYEQMAGTYTQVFQSLYGCDSTHTIALTVLPALHTAQNLSVCKGDSVLVFGQFVQDAGVYTGIFQAAGGCDSIVTIMLQDQAAPALQSTVIPSCSDTLTGAISVVSTGGAPPYSISWAQNGLSGFAVSGLDAGDYTATVTDQMGCTSALSVSVLEVEAPVLDLQWLDPTCFGFADGQLIIQNAPTSLVFSLDGALFSIAQTYAGLSAGAHTLQTLDTAGCILETQTFLVEPPPLLVYLPGDTLLEQGHFVEIQSEVVGNVAHYTWSPGTGLDCPVCPVVQAKPAESTQYTLTVSDSSGCTASDQIQITVQQEPSKKVYIPNIFMPGSGGSNQHFTVYAGDNVREVLRLEVYDRWGELVFRREHFAPGVEALAWDGTARGQLVLPGVYVYDVEVAFSDGTTSHISGDVTVVR